MVLIIIIIIIIIIIVLLHTLCRVHVFEHVCLNVCFCLMASYTVRVAVP
jgi:hypothetical protein